MSLYVLDTDTMTLYQHGHPRVAQQVLAHPMADLAIAVISVEEELTGWYTKLRQVRKRDQLARVYQRLSEAVPFFARFLRGLRQNEFGDLAAKTIARIERGETAAPHGRTLGLIAARLAVEPNEITSY